MNSRIMSCIATLASAVVFGCGGAFFLFGGIAKLQGKGTYEIEINGVIVAAGKTHPAYGWLGIAVGLILFLIPVVIGVVTLRQKPKLVPPVSNEPLPPAS